MSDFPPPVPPSPSSDPPPPQDQGSFMIGCLMGGAITIAFAVLSVVMVVVLGNATRGQYANYLFVSWGITQWIGIIPMILRERSKGRRNGVAGLVVAGCVGLLLSSACAELVFNLGNMH